MTVSDAKMDAATIGINSFVRRQTKDSKFSYFTGSDAELILYAQQNWPLRRQGNRPDSWIVPIDMGHNLDESVPQFYSAIIRINPDMFLNAECIVRSKNEEPLMCVSTISSKARGRYVDVVIYAAVLLGEERSSTSDLGIVSFHVSDVQHQPEHPYEIARKILDQWDGPKMQYEPEEIALSIMYWSQRAFVRPQFNRHIDPTIVNLIKKGKSDAAETVRRAKCPDESAEDARAYIISVRRFMNEIACIYGDRPDMQYC